MWGRRGRQGPGPGLSPSAPGSWGSSSPINPPSRPPEPSFAQTESPGGRGRGLSRGLGAGPRGSGYALLWAHRRGGQVTDGQRGQLPGWALPGRSQGWGAGSAGCGLKAERVGTPQTSASCRQSHWVPVNPLQPGVSLRLTLPQGDPELPPCRVRHTSQPALGHLSPAPGHRQRPARPGEGSHSAVGAPGREGGRRRAGAARWERVLISSSDQAAHLRLRPTELGRQASSSQGQASLRPPRCWCGRGGGARAQGSGLGGGLSSERLRDRGRAGWGRLDRADAAGDTGGRTLPDKLFPNPGPHGEGVGAG